MDLTIPNFGNSENWLLVGISDASNKTRNENPIPVNVTYSTDDDENYHNQWKMSIPDSDISTNDSLGIGSSPSRKNLMILQLFQMMVEALSDNSISALKSFFL